MRPLRERLLSSTAASSPPDVVVDPDDLDAPATSPDPNALLPPRAAARRLNVAVQTLARWRMQRRGPPFHLVGGHIGYRLRDVEAWLAKRRVVGTDDADGD